MDKVDTDLQNREMRDKLTDQFTSGSRHIESEMKSPRYKTTEIANKISEAKSTGVTKPKENTLVTWPDANCQPPVEVLIKAAIFMLGITHLSPHNELVPLPYIAEQTRRWRAASYRSSHLIQLSGRTSVGRAGSGADLAGCGSLTEIFPSASGGLPPRLLPPFEGGWVNCPASEAPLKRGMPTGPRAFLGNSGRVWAMALRRSRVFLGKSGRVWLRPCAT